MRRLYPLALALLIIPACGPDLVYSEVKTEPGRVKQLVFVPSGHGTGVGVGPILGGNGGVSVTSTSVDVPERYGLVFECRHGTFAVEGERYKALWQSLREGQAVTIRYREVYERRAAGTGTGPDRFVRYEFLGCDPA